MAAPHLRVVSEPPSAKLADLHKMARANAEEHTLAFRASVETLEAEAREIAKASDAFYPVGVKSKANLLANQLRDAREGIEAIKGRSQ